MWESVSTPQLTRLILLLLRRTIRGCSLPAILICEGSFNSQRGLGCWEVGDETAVAGPGRAERPSADCQPEPPPRLSSQASPTHQLTSAKPCPIDLLRNHATSLLSRPWGLPRVLTTFHKLAQTASWASAPRTCPLMDMPHPLASLLFPRTHQAHFHLRAAGLLLSLPGTLNPKIVHGLLLHSTQDSIQRSPPQRGCP